MIYCHQNVVLLLLDSYRFHQWPGFHKPKQVPLLLMWLWGIWRLCLEIGSVHVLYWTKRLGTKILTGCLLSRASCSLIFSSVCFFPCLYSFTDCDIVAKFASQKVHPDFKIWNFFKQVPMITSLENWYVFC